MKLRCLRFYGLFCHQSATPKVVHISRTHVVELFCSQNLYICVLGRVPPLWFFPTPSSQMTSILTTILNSSLTIQEQSTNISFCSPDAVSIQGCAEIRLSPLQPLQLSIDTRNSTRLFYCPCSFFLPFSH